MAGEVGSTVPAGTYSALFGGVPSTSQPTGGSKGTGAVQSPFQPIPIDYTRTGVVKPPLSDVVSSPTGPTSPGNDGAGVA